MTRGFVYQGGQLLAVQQNNQVSWVHQDPFAKSKRVTNSSGNVVSIVELDPWGGDTTRSSNSGFQPRFFTTCDRDGNQSDEAMHRRYNRWHARFDQPDPYGGSMNLADPQSFNRYAYVQNDPVNFVDPSGLFPEPMVPLPGQWSVDVPISFDSPIDGGVIGGIIGDTGILIETGGEPEPGGGGGGAEPEPQNAQNAQNTDTRTSCQRFADIVEELSRNNPHLIPSDFVERLFRRFANLRNEFSSDGFKVSFQDFGGSPDQARHYIGGLSAGFIATQWGSETFGRWVADAREYDFVVTMDTVLPLVYPVQNDSQRADQRLNAVSTRHGAALSNGEIKPFQLADLIRREVCQ
jgi:RHS repeat-associated protein